MPSARQRRDYAHRPGAVSPWHECAPGADRVCARYLTASRPCEWSSRIKARISSPDLGNAVKGVTSAFAIKSHEGSAGRPAALAREFAFRRQPRIFVAIASYRDPQLVPTIIDCIRKAKWPQRLRFGICWQHGPDEPEFPFGHDASFRVADIDWRESQGACWARAVTMKMWDGEEYYLQVDSHSRFVRHWDSKLVRLARIVDSSKPLFSSTPAAFSSKDGDVYITHDACKLNYDGFTEDSIVLTVADSIPASLKGRRPAIRARFVAAGFIFTSGAICEEVPYDPGLYFVGEEITMTVRAFTAGFDLFHPTSIFLWHDYYSYERRRHWTDHVGGPGVTEWWVNDAKSKAKVRDFLTQPYVGEYGCGLARPFAAYEAYAGLDFKRRRAQDYTCRHEEPPNPPQPPDRAGTVRRWRACITLDRASLPTRMFSESELWYVGFHTAEPREIHRADASGAEFDALISGHLREIVIMREFESPDEPVSWTIWAYAREGTWLDRIDGKFTDANASLTTT